MPNRIWLCGDTHMHSSISDGKYTPNELIEKCKTKGLDWIIITDHNKNAVGDKSYYSEKSARHSRRRIHRAKRAHEYIRERAARI